jgi:hypothetical protein
MRSLLSTDPVRSWSFAVGFSSQQHGGSPRALPAKLITAVVKLAFNVSGDAVVLAVNLFTLFEGKTGGF